MAKRAEDMVLDPAVIPIGDAPAEGAFDEWLARLRDGEPTVLPVSAAQLVAEARAETE